jgi:hypothetical protein
MPNHAPPDRAIDVHRTKKYTLLPREKCVKKQTPYLWRRPGCSQKLPCHRRLGSCKGQIRLQTGMHYRSKSADESFARAAGESHDQIGKDRSKV